MTLRYRSRPVAPRRRQRHAGKQATLLVANGEVQVLNTDGEITAEFAIDPSKDYQTRKKGA